MAKKHAPSSAQSAPAVAQPESDHQHPQFVPGQKVRDVFGRVHEVAEQVGCAVYLKGQSGWFHPAKLFPVA